MQMSKQHSQIIIKKEATDETPELIAEKALNEFHNLKNKIEDIVWLETIEDQLAKLAVAICSTRLDIVNRLSIFLLEEITGFPKLKIEFIDSIENNLLKRDPQ